MMLVALSHATATVFATVVPSTRKLGGPNRDTALATAWAKAWSAPPPSRAGWLGKPVPAVVPNVMTAICVLSRVRPTWPPDRGLLSTRVPGAGRDQSPGQ